MNTFAVGRVTGKRVHAEECGDRLSVKYAKGSFLCIDCGKEVYVRRGEQRAWHFSHYSQRDGSRCPHANGGETLQHYRAKHFVAANLGRCAFAVERCPGCGATRFFVGRNKNGKRVFVHECRAEVERRIMDHHSRVADVAAIDPSTGDVVAAIEIFHTHAVDAAKRQECSRQGIAVLEVNAEDVLAHCKEQQRRGQHFLQLETVGMNLGNDCNACAVKKARLQQMQRRVDWEAWYVCMWERHCICSSRIRQRQMMMVPSSCFRSVVKAADSAIANAAVQNLERVRTVEAWHNELWEGYGNLLLARRMDEASQVEAAGMRRRARDEAHARIQEAEVTAAKKQLLQPKGGTKCIGKCRQCSRWMMFDDGGSSDAVAVVSSSTMPERAWDQLFSEEPSKYQKRYVNVVGEHSTILVHKECSMACPGCGEPCLLHSIARFGMCYPCNNNCSKKKRHATLLRSEWAMRGRWDDLLLLT